MTRRHWRNPDATLEGWYGLGTISGSLAGWDWFGHWGSLQGYITRTAVLPTGGLTISILTNAIDGWAGVWLDGVLHIMRAFADRGAPPRKLGGWSGRWCPIWGAVDLVATGKGVLICNPYLCNPVFDASEIGIQGRDKGRITRSTGYGSFGEPAGLVRNTAGEVSEVWLGATLLLPEAALATDMQQRYAPAPPPKRRNGAAVRSG